MHLFLQNLFYLSFSKDLNPCISFYASYNMFFVFLEHASHVMRLVSSIAFYLENVQLKRTMLPYLGLIFFAPSCGIKGSNNKSPYPSQL